MEKRSKIKARLAQKIKEQNPLDLEKIYQACEQDDVDSLRTLLAGHKGKGDIDIDKTIPCFDRILGAHKISSLSVYVIYLCKLKTFKYLVEERDLTLGEFEKNVAYTLCCMFKQLGMLKYLIEKFKIKTDQITLPGHAGVVKFNPILYVILGHIHAHDQKQTLEFLQFLIQLNVDINAMHDGVETPAIGLAARRGYVGIYLLLFNAGANVLYDEKNENALLWEAVKGGDATILTHALNHCQSKSFMKEINIVLNSAVQEGDLKVVKIVLNWHYAKNSSIFSVDAINKIIYALMLRRKTKKMPNDCAIADYLILKGPWNVEQPIKYGDNACSWLCMAFLFNDLEMVNFLIKKHCAKTQAADFSTHTLKFGKKLFSPLTAAVLGNCSLEYFQPLIKTKAPLFPKNSEGELFLLRQAVDANHINAALSLLQLYHDSEERTKHEKQIQGEVQQACQDAYAKKAYQMFALLLDYGKFSQAEFGVADWGKKQLEYIQFYSCVASLITRDEDIQRRHIRIDAIVEAFLDLFKSFEIVRTQPDVFQVKCKVNLHKIASRRHKIKDALYTFDQSACFEFINSMNLLELPFDKNKFQLAFFPFLHEANVSKDKQEEKNKHEILMLKKASVLKQSFLESKKDHTIRTEEMTKKISLLELLCTQFEGLVKDSRVTEDALSPTIALLKQHMHDYTTYLEASKKQFAELYSDDVEELMGHDFSNIVIGKFNLKNLDKLALQLSACHQSLRDMSEYILKINIIIKKYNKLYLKLKPRESTEKASTLAVQVNLEKKKARKTAEQQAIQDQVQESDKAKEDHKKERALLMQKRTDVKAQVDKAKQATRLTMRAPVASLASGGVDEQDEKSMDEVRRHMPISNTLFDHVFYAQADNWLSKAETAIALINGLKEAEKLNREKPDIILLEKNALLRNLELVLQTILIDRATAPGFKVLVELARDAIYHDYDLTNAADVFIDNDELYVLIGKLIELRQSNLHVNPTLDFMANIDFPLFAELVNRGRTLQPKTIDRIDPTFSMRKFRIERVYLTLKEGEISLDRIEDPELDRIKSLASQSIIARQGCNLKELRLLAVLMDPNDPEENVEKARFQGYIEELTENETLNAALLRHSPGYSIANLPAPLFVPQYTSAVVSSVSSLPSPGATHHPLP